MLFPTSSILCGTHCFHLCAMKKYQGIVVFLLRVSLAAGFLSAVASRLGLWGKQSSGWKGFITYTGQVVSFVPVHAIPLVAVVSTVAETGLGIALLIGLKTSYAAVGAGVLTLLFALSMAWSFGIKEPLDYSVFAFCTAAFLLSGMPYYRWSVDELINHKK
jgi:putative oxidoreductase